MELKQRSAARGPPILQLSSGPEARSPAARPLPSPPAPLPALLFSPSHPHLNSSLWVEEKLKRRTWLPTCSRASQCKQQQTVHQNPEKPTGKKDKLKAQGHLSSSHTAFVSLSPWKTRDAHSPSLALPVGLKGHQLGTPTRKGGTSSSICREGREANHIMALRLLARARHCIEQLLKEAAPLFKCFFRFYLQQRDAKCIQNTFQYEIK